MEEGRTREFQIYIEAMTTEQQLESFKELKNLLADDLPKDIEDLKILKFLIARDYDVSKAADMLKYHLTYWNKLGLYKILTNFTLPEKSRYFLTAVLGFDSEGSLVRILRVGASDLQGLALSHTKFESSIVASHILEEDKKKQKQRFSRTGQGGDDKQTYIFDLEGLRWLTLFCRPLVQKFTYMLKLYESNYPESLKMVYIVNAPSFFNIIYNFVKNILPAEILKKVTIISDNTSLASFLPPEILPQYLGGILTDENKDPYCGHLFYVPKDTLVPEKFYLRSTLEKDPDAKKATVLAQNNFTVRHEVNRVPCLLIWDFQTEENDIAMGLLLKEDNSPIWLLHLRRFNSHKYVESGRYLCQKPGIYEFFFDNSYSWWSAKELTYKIQVFQNDESDANS